MSNKNGKKIECVICGKPVSNPDEVKDPQNYVCPECCIPCKVCGKRDGPPHLGAVEGEYVCLKCHKIIKPGLRMIHFLQHIKNSEDDELRFAIRELVQNADDAEATTMSIRVDKDALYVANDGYNFRPPDEERGWAGDYRRICEVLSKPKLKDPKSTGAHGSGFTTVYCFTNHPEVHSGGNFAEIDAVKEDFIELKGAHRSQLRRRKGKGRLQ